MIHARRILARKLTEQAAATIKCLRQGRRNLVIIDDLENDEEFTEEKKAKLIKWYDEVIDKPQNKV